MELEKQVTNLQLSQKLNEIGVNQDSLFYWVYDNKLSTWQLGFCDEMPHESEKCYSALTSCELLELLPLRIVTQHNEPFNGFRFNMTRSLLVHTGDGYIVDKTFNANYYCDSFSLHQPDAFNDKLINIPVYDSSLSNCLAKVLIYLVENKLLELTK